MINLKFLKLYLIIKVDSRVKHNFYEWNMFLWSSNWTNFIILWYHHPDGIENMSSNYALFFRTLKFSIFSCRWSTSGIPTTWRYSSYNVHKWLNRCTQRSVDFYIEFLHILLKILLIFYFHFLVFFRYMLKKIKCPIWSGFTVNPSLYHG